MLLILFLMQTSENFIYFKNNEGRECIVYIRLKVIWHIAYSYDQGFFHIQVSVRI
jgi:hypothetical protein